MREIKFRLWDKMGHRLVMPDDILLIDFEAEVLSYKEKRYADNGICLGFYVVKGLIKQFEILQYTGLKDKNGTEIYEGDILQGTYYFRGVGWYDTGEGDVEIKGKVVYEQGGYECQGYNLGDLTNDVEIIGNIYENPELLN